ncbi:hypothetical protein BHM03_00028845 [Ensete ventricosum]|nr:hypothetical protein BHM03_00028845 [Ensete ventricosum]
MRRRRLPLPNGSHPAKGRSPLRPAPPPILASRRRPCPQAPPLQAASPASRTGLPCSLALATAGSLCRGPWSWLGHGEIVYPCIPDSDGEDEGGQASSSLAVSTRWISTAKLLQSELATLAQRREENRRGRPKL